MSTIDNSQPGFRLVTKGALQNLGQSRLSSRHPTRIVLAHRFFIVAEQVGHGGDGNATQEDARERVPESVLRGFFGADVRKLEHLCEPLPPDISDAEKAQWSKQKARANK